MITNNVRFSSHRDVSWVEKCKVFRIRSVGTFHAKAVEVYCHFFDMLKFHLSKFIVYRATSEISSSAQSLFDISFD